MSTHEYKFKILIPIWGEKYIDMFCDYGLPSLLTEGNLYTLAKYANVAICILTVKSNAEYFFCNALFTKLKNTFDVSFSYIDGLLGTSAYGVTLTYAYAQGISEEPEEVQISTYFIFLNADFVLSETTFLNLLQILKDGKIAVISPSLRCNGEAVMQKLSYDMASKKEVFNNSARHLVRLALDNMHPTVCSKIINQQFLLNDAINQFYWVVDPNTLLARFFLMSMFCIKPEKKFKKVVNYCDYSFVQDLCPSGNYSVVDDSDAIFILELAATKHESHYIYVEQASASYYAKQLSSWTTKWQRDYAEVTLFFHAEDLPSSYVQAKDQMHDYMQQVKNSLGSPCDYDNHPYWPSTHTLENINSQINYTKKQKKSYFGAIVRDLQKFIIGCPPYVRRWHPDWLDYIMIQDLLNKKLFDKNTTILYIKDCVNFFDDLFVKQKNNVQTLDLNRLVANKNDFCLLGATPAICIIHLLPQSLCHVGSILKYCSKVPDMLFFINGISCQHNSVYELFDTFGPCCTKIKYSYCVSDMMKNSLKSDITKLRERVWGLAMLQRIFVCVKIFYKIFLLFILVKLNSNQIPKVKLDSFYSTAGFLISSS